MAEILPRHYIIAIIIFTMIITAGVNIISDFATDNSNFLDNDKFDMFNRTFNQQKNLNKSIGGLQQSIESADTDPGLFGFLDALVGSAWNAIKSIFSSFGFMATVIGGLYKVLGIPAWVGNLILSIITIIIVFAIFTVIFQREI